MNGPYGVFTLDDTKNDTDTETHSDDYGFYCNMQSTSHCTETLPLMSLATFSHFISLRAYIVPGVAQCVHTINIFERYFSCNLLVLDVKRVPNVFIISKAIFWKCHGNYWSHIYPKVSRCLLIK